jgi:subtilisin family serine protease
VGSYDAHRGNVPLSYFSSCGPTRDKRQKPEISAPGHDVKAAKSGSLVGVTTKSGTSMAAPAVTGAIAVLLAEAINRGITLPIEQIRNCVIRSARKNPPSSQGWHDRYGFGRISVKGMIAQLKERRPTPVKKKAALKLVSTDKTRKRGKK